MWSKIRALLLGCLAFALIAPVVLAAGSSPLTITATATPDLQKTGKQVSVEATATSDTGGAVPGTQVAVAVTAGPNADADLDEDAATPAGYAGACTTDAEGRCTVSYTGASAGSDAVTAWVDTNSDKAPSEGEPSGTASARWVTRLVDGTASLATKAAVVYGSALVFKGVVDADHPCRAGRAVQLKRRRVGATAWEQIGTATSGKDGAFRYRVSPAQNAAYRAVVDSDVRSGVGCTTIFSPKRLNAVRARVTARPADSSVAAGNCTKLSVSVSPNKSGQQIRVQRRAGSGWTRIGTATLDALSEARPKLCFRWSSLGTQKLRAVWPKQDRSNATGASPVASLTVAKALWMQRIDHLAAGHTIGIAIRAEGRFLYARTDTSAFTPASNEKLLLSMALLDRFGPQFELPTTAAVPSVTNGVVRGNLWIFGSGNPAVRKPAMAALAKSIVAAGVRGIRGSVMGSTTYFAHDWWAPGWKSFFPAEDIALPTALTFRGNEVRGVHVRDPERLAARALTRRLKALGVRVRGVAGSGRPSGKLQRIAVARSRPLADLMRHMNHDSDNFYAEVLGKRLGVGAYGAPGTIAKGAAAIDAWVRGQGIGVAAYDSSGLSYSNRITPAGITRLLQLANHQAWGPVLRRSLAAPGEHGTLEDRLKGVRVRAKTGTLEYISALSGWVWLDRLDTWAEFSILSRGMYSDTAKAIENSIVRLAARYGH